MSIKTTKVLQYFVSNLTKKKNNQHNVKLLRMKPISHKVFQNESNISMNDLCAWFVTNFNVTIIKSLSPWIERFDFII
jgi:hypothetical protein